MRIGIGEGRTLGLLLQAQMLEFAFTGFEPVGNLAQGAGLSQLTEEHSDELVPAGKAARVVFGFELADVAGEIGTLKKFEDLAKKTGGGIHLDLRLMMSLGFTITPM